MITAYDPRADWAKEDREHCVDELYVVTFARGDDIQGLRRMPLADATGLTCYAARWTHRTGRILPVPPPSDVGCPDSRAG
jgi:hypothetical protein